MLICEWEIWWAPWPSTSCSSTLPSLPTPTRCSAVSAPTATLDHAAATGDVPGLEVWDEESQSYYPVPPIEGAYVVHLGNLFQQWTNDKYMSNVHRVINRSDVDRYSIPFNYNGNLDFVIRCIESCRAKPEDEKYAPISVDDYIRQKYKDVYGRVGIYSVAERVKT